MKINDIVEIKIEKLVFGGEGLGYLNDFAIFVPMSVPGDVLSIKLISLNKNYGRGLIEKIILPSNDRLDNKKITFEDYSGCDFAMIKYDKQVLYKSEILKDILKHLGKISIENIPFEKSDDIYNYRNKVAEPFVKIKGKIHTGFYQKRTHDIFVADEYNLRSICCNYIMNDLLEEMNKFKGTKREFKVYNDVNKSGLLKTCIVRNNSKGELLLVLVVDKESNLNRLKDFLLYFYKKHDNLKSIYISIKNKKDNVIFGEETYKIAGLDYIEENIMGINFKIYPDSFFQINRNQTIKLYNDAINLLGDYSDKNIIDAFSGTGTISMIMSLKAKKVYGIELVKSSVIAARKTVKDNNINNVEFIEARVEHVIDKIMNKDKIDYIVFDPPRKGIDYSVLESVCESNISKIVYISCNPSTLARDIKILIEKGYRLEYVKGYDMFPQTHHIEVLVLLVKGE